MSAIVSMPGRGARVKCSGALKEGFVAYIVRMEWLHCRFLRKAFESAVAKEAAAMAQAKK